MRYIVYCAVHQLPMRHAVLPRNKSTEEFISAWKGFGDSEILCRHQNFTSLPVNDQSAPLIYCLMAVLKEYIYIYHCSNTWSLLSKKPTVSVHSAVSCIDINFVSKRAVRFDTFTRLFNYRLGYLSMNSSHCSIFNGKETTLTTRFKPERVFGR
jgi:hypothetical protein